jgi:Domain of unknown function (DUF3806)
MNFSKLLDALRHSFVRLIGPRARPSHFTADPQVQQIAEAYALDALDFTEHAFHIALDWSDASVERVEAILDSLYRQKQTMEPPLMDEQVVTFAKMLGSYIGEVFRRNHGGEWGMVTFGGDSIPGLRATRTEHLFWPMAKVQKRLVNGFEDNVWHYYQSLLQSHRRDMRWWRRWRRWRGSKTSS